MILVLWDIDSVLTGFAAVAFALTMGAFSVHGRATGELPRLIAGFGIVAAAVAFVGGIPVLWIADGTWPLAIGAAGYVGFLVWVALVAVWELRGGGLAEWPA